ncbi:MAG: MCP four helix bundle domain-containing protein [Vicinamibacterales bacterium]|jgi:hypothetical protein
MMGLRYGSAVMLLACAIGCAGDPALRRLFEARRLSADLLQQFTSAADATNRTVMAGGNDLSKRSARQAEDATAAAQRNAEALKPLLESLGYAEESRLLAEFRRRFDDYRALDGRILALALEGSNVKAHEQASGPAHEAANAVQQGIQKATDSVPADAMWRGRALGATAVAAVREIQVLQFQHIPEDDDAAMTRLEQQMAAAEAVARQSLRQLALALPASPQAALAQAHTAFDRFIALNVEITSLSRRNSNVRALALALGEKGVLAARCEDGLRALQDALGKRDVRATR